MYVMLFYLNNLIKLRYFFLYSELYFPYKKNYIFRFRELSEGNMPLGVKKVRKPNLQKRDLKKESKKATLRLIQFEKKLFSDNINKKQKRKKTRDAIANEALLEQNSKTDTIDSKNESIDTEIMKSNLQDTDTNIVPPKKRKINLTCEDNKNIIIKDKNKTKQETKAHNEFNKTKKIKLNQMYDTFITDNIKCKPKKTMLHEKHKKQYSVSPISKKNSVKEAASKKSLAFKQTMLEKNVMHNDQGIQLKNVSISILILSSDD